MKYFIAYKQDENTYLFITSIGKKIETSMFYGNALDFLSKKNADNICKFINEYDTKHNYLVLEYEYSITEI